MSAFEGILLNANGQWWWCGAAALLALGGGDVVGGARSSGGDSMDNDGMRELCLLVTQCTSAPAYKRSPSSSASAFT